MNERVQTETLTTRILKLLSLVAVLSLVYSMLELARLIYTCIQIGYEPRMLLIAELAFIAYGLAFFASAGIYYFFQNLKRSNRDGRI